MWLLGDWNSCTTRLIRRSKTMTADLTKTGTKQECQNKAEYFLGKAVQYEADPDKGEKYANMAFKAALKHEDAAFDGRD